LRIFTLTDMRLTLALSRCVCMLASHHQAAWAADPLIF
jgi:hypothetical protein